MEKTFLECFANMYLGKLPDFGMRVEFTPNLTRYIGAGSEPFDYSITSQTLCSPEEFRDQVRQEIRLADSRNRTTFEWKVFETWGMPFQTQILAESNFFRRRTARLRFCKSDYEGKTPASVVVKRVSTEADFETLLDINEAAFGTRSLWLRESLGLEIKENPELVQAFIALVDGKPACAAWIKIFNEIGFLFGGGTVPELRGRGSYKALVQVRAAFAYKVGAKYILSECSPDSDRVLESLGFTDGGSAEKWIYPAP